MSRDNNKDHYHNRNGKVYNGHEIHYNLSQMFEIIHFNVLQYKLDFGSTGHGLLGLLLTRGLFY